MGVAATWSGGFPVRPGEDDDEEAVVVRFARLLATLATEIMDSLKRVENSGCRPRAGTGRRRAIGLMDGCSLPSPPLSFPPCKL